MIASLFAIFKRQAQRDEFDDDELDNFDIEVKSRKDSPFFAYLGHNILTEGCANDPNNTSVDAIARIPEHVLLRNAVINNLRDEPVRYSDTNSSPTLDGRPIQHQRSYTYPDTKREQLRYDRVEQIYDVAHDRRWQRRTMHACGI